MIREREKDFPMRIKRTSRVWLACRGALTAVYWLILSAMMPNVAKPAESNWSATTGKLKLTFKRPSQLYPALDLTDTVEVTGLVSPDKPGGSDRLMLWIGIPATTTADESTGAKLLLSEESAGDEESEQKDDSGSVDALAKQLKGQRWDADKSAWK